MITNTRHKAKKKNQTLTRETQTTAFQSIKLFSDELMMLKNDTDA
jgi:hypothetical protein